MIKFLSDVTSGLRYNSKTLCLSLGAATASDTEMEYGHLLDDTTPCIEKR